MFTVKEFKFLSPNDIKYMEYNNWSRVYEYAYILNELRHMHEIDSIHNTCAGTQPIHMLFANELEKLCDNVLHSDYVSCKINNELKKFKLYDISAEPMDEKFDVVICISTLEEMPVGLREKSFHNLLGQVKSGGRLLITCDYPDVSLEFCETLMGTKIREPSIRLNGLNSIYRNGEFERLNIIVMDLIKE